MILKDYFECSRPIYFENDDPVYEYSGKGTSFVVGYQSEYYVFTANHVLKDFDKDSISIFFSDTSKEFIPFNMSYPVTYPPKIDSDIADIAVLRIDKNLISTEQINSFKAINLDSDIHKRIDVKKGGKLIFHGYPENNRDIDYKNRVLKQQRVIMDGNYDGISIEEHIHQISIEEVNGVTTFNGFSGSPVIRVVDTSDGKYDANLVGMVLRGGIESRKLHYIDSIILYKILDEIDKTL